MELTNEHSFFEQHCILLNNTDLSRGIKHLVPYILFLHQSAVLTSQPQCLSQSSSTKNHTYLGDEIHKILIWISTLCHVTTHPINSILAVSDTVILDGSLEWTSKVHDKCLVVILCSYTITSVEVLLQGLVFFCVDSLESCTNVACALGIRLRKKIQCK